MEMSAEQHLLDTSDALRHPPHPGCERLDGHGKEMERGQQDAHKEQRHQDGHQRDDEQSLHPAEQRDLMEPIGDHGRGEPLRRHRQEDEPQPTGETFGLQPRLEKQDARHGKETQLEAHLADRPRIPGDEHEGGEDHTTPSRRGAMEHPPEHQQGEHQRGTHGTGRSSNKPDIAGREGNHDDALEVTQHVMDGEVERCQIPDEHLDGTETYPDDRHDDADMEAGDSHNVAHPRRPEGADHLGRQTRLVAQEHTLRQGNGFVGESEFVQTFEHQSV